jgi:mannitol-1-phosphate/altronate dehydrogenase
LQPRLSNACAQKQDPVGAVLSIAEIFGSDLKQDARFEKGVRQAYDRLRISGVLASVELACQHAGKAN